MRGAPVWLGALVVLLATGAALAAIAAPAGGAAPAAWREAGGCAMPPAEGAPSYYAIELVNTGRVPGNAHAQGVAEVRFPDGPFGVAVAPDGTYVQELTVRLAGLRLRQGRVAVVWATTTELDRVERLALFEADGAASGTVRWNKYLVVVSIEQRGAIAERWRGPILMRGMSRSGRMHTMAGHGPFAGEPCVKFGY